MAGFLDNSQIIIDAVLTDVGREILAKNDKSFSMTKFALGDDEINYNIIKKYGQTVGEQKIKLNTPILEAFTAQSQGQKFKLISIDNQNLSRLPKIILQSADNNTNNSINLIVNTTTDTDRKSKITLEQTINSGNTIDPQLVDQTYLIELNRKFLFVDGAIYDSQESNGIVYYELGRTGQTNTSGGSQLIFTIKVQTISQTQFSLYGNFSDKNSISTRVKITGMNSGAVKEIIVNIKKQ